MQQKECSKCKRWTSSPDGLCDDCLIESYGIPIFEEEGERGEILRYVPIGELARWLRTRKEGQMVKQGRMVLFVMQTNVNDKGEYNALIAVEGEKGYYKTDWYWGKDFAVAEQIADERNAEVGISKLDAWKIVASTMRK